MQILLQAARCLNFHVLAVRWDNLQLLVPLDNDGI